MNIIKLVELVDKPGHNSVVAYLRIWNIWCYTIRFCLTFVFVSLFPLIIFLGLLNNVLGSDLSFGALLISELLLFAYVPTLIKNEEPNLQAVSVIGFLSGIGLALFLGKSFEIAFLWGAGFTILFF